MRGVAPRRILPNVAAPSPVGLRVCGLLECHALILSLPGTTPTNRCDEHQGMENEPETDDAFMTRVCREMGWRRRR